ncbi:MAG TPA: exodeoxyribonuclease VII small subunit [Ktedonobacterales bacterium]|nr:exodeoxyribonuclease VII small subunit [Ktedonobacterales bacterium]
MSAKTHSNGQESPLTSGTPGAQHRRARHAANAEAASPADEKLSFEEALARLDEIVASLEDGGLPLDDALALFERGVGLARGCQEQLDQASLRVERLRALGGFAIPDADDEDTQATGASYYLEVFDADE